MYSSAKEAGTPAYRISGLLLFYVIRNEFIIIWEQHTKRCTLFLGDDCLTPLESRMAYKISIQSMMINLFLFAFKGLFGIKIASASLLSDAVHSLADIFSTLAVLIGIRVSHKPSDFGHPYGHEKIECIVAFVLGMMLFGIGGSIGWNGIRKLFEPSPALLPNWRLSTWAMGAAVVSIAAKEWMYRFTIKCAKKIRSASMEADAWHHRSDALSSVGSLVGIAGMRLGVAAVDSVACIVISAFIFKAAYEICADACRKLIDSSCPPELVSSIERIAKSNREVMAIDALKTRWCGSRVYVDMEITLDRNTSFEHAHKVAENIHDEIEGNFAVVKHCMIHVNPSALINHHHI
ncbi:MAG: Cation transporter [Oscillospiraceae bacterium]